MKSTAIAAALAVALAASLADAPAVFAQSDGYPSRPITIIVPFPPGGSSDTVTRLVAQKLGENLKTNAFSVEATSNAGRSWTTQYTVG